MDVLPSGSIFRELQDIHDTGYFSAQPSLEDHFQQVCVLLLFVPMKGDGRSKCSVRLSINFQCKVSKSNSCKFKGSPITSWGLP
ncbi:uncharacterized protein LOC113469663 isoform X1 [Diaphorina citri]|uniref:Uncharacterized protein LOC113469663 isoform X1 n=1 Tax=Diaphorina citri TaxID=121845 RepID=A0A3Q0J4A2_DIACI|nr:uncharacterized protein LOC113469663 isoform X1 [Diaphorina citri]